MPTIRRATASSAQDEVRELLINCPARPYLLACRRDGRAHVEPGMRGALLELLAALRVVGPLPETFGLARAQALAVRFLSIEEAIAQGALDYPAYLNLPLIEDFLQGAGGSAVLAQARIAFATILSDWLREEEHALALADVDAPPHRFVRASVAERVAALRDLVAFTGSAGVPLALPTLRHWMPALPDWASLADDAKGLLGLVLLSALPQSHFHDELMFVRITQLAECCFIAGWTALTEAEQLVADPAQALDRVKRASAQIALLLKLFHSVFRTLPKENFFDGFRPETGGSSALQSRNYQRLDKAIRGLGRDKAAVFAGEPLLADLAEDPALPANVVRRLAEAVDGSPRWSAANRHQLYYHLGQIERSFLAWRTFHLGIARDYLPPAARGTGGMGVAFLERTLDLPGGVTGVPGLVALPVSADGSSGLAGGFWVTLRPDATVSMPAGQLLVRRLRGIGAILSFHNSRRINGTPWIDTADAGEFFVGADGAPLRCRGGETVVRDGKGIVAAERGGASSRTAARLGAVLPAGATLEAMVLMPAADGHRATEQVTAEVTAAFAPYGEFTIRPLRNAV